MRPFIMHVREHKVMQQRRVLTSHGCFCSDYLFFFTVANYSWRIYDVKISIVFAFQGNYAETLPRWQMFLKMIYISFLWASNQMFFIFAIIFMWITNVHITLKLIIFPHCEFSLSLDIQRNRRLQHTNQMAKRRRPTTRYAGLRLFWGVLSK